MTKQYVLEWSQKTNNFHIQPLDNLLANNQCAFMEDKKTQDYIVIFVGEKEPVQRMADNWRNRIEKREKPMTIKEAMAVGI